MAKNSVGVETAIRAVSDFHELKNERRQVEFELRVNISILNSQSY